MCFVNLHETKVHPSFVFHCLLGREPWEVPDKTGGENYPENRRGVRGTVVGGPQAWSRMWLQPGGPGNWSGSTHGAAWLASHNLTLQHGNQGCLETSRNCFCGFKIEPEPEAEWKWYLPSYCLLSHEPTAFISVLGPLRSTAFQESMTRKERLVDHEEQDKVFPTLP